MRNYIHLILLLLCLCGKLHAQTPILDRKVTLQYREEEIGTILKDMNKKYNIKFSYSNNIVPEKKKVSINIKNVMLKDALYELFDKTDVAFQVLGDQVVLKKGLKRNSTSIAKYKVVNVEELVTAPPVLFDPKIIQENLMVSNTEDFIIDTMPDELGMEVPMLREEDYTPSKRDLRRKYKGERKMLKAKFYLLKDSLRGNGGNTAAKINLKYNYVAQKMKQEFNDLRYSENRFKKDNTITPKDTIPVKDTSAVIEKEKYWYRPFQISFVSPIGTNGYDCGRTVNNISVNIIGGYAAGLEGIELGGIANIEKDYVDGIQLAGFCNVVKNKTNGIQLAGFINACGDSVKALQGAGFCNVVNGSFYGMQTAGFCNIERGSVNGFQGAGFLNVSQDSLYGAQIAGFANLHNGDVNGIQASGFLNTAKKVKGVQIGIINICDTIQGIPIGCLSIVKNGGYRRVDIFGSEALYANAAFKIGVRRFYNIIQVGAKLADNNLFLAGGFGVGSELKLGNRIVTNIENVSLYVWEQEKVEPELNMLNKISSTLGVRIGKKTTIYAGPTLNVMVSSQYQNATKDEPGSDFAPYTFYNNTFDSSTKDVNLKMWVGFNAGIRF